MSLRFLLIFIFAFPFFPPAWAEEKAQPRILAALYDSEENATVRPTRMHRFLEMPANYLGFDIRYFDIRKPLPVLGDEVKGIVLWFSPGYSVPHAEPYLDWLDAQTGTGKKLLILENAGIGDVPRRQEAIMQHYNRILARIGVQDANAWNAVTYRAHVEQIDPQLAGFERQIGPVLPPFGDTRLIPGKATSHLRVMARIREEEEPVDLITTSPQGGYVAEGYAVFEVVEEDESKIVQWFINPFAFLQRSLDMGQIPIPDITTLNGRRIFYGHIDGDGWNNLCEITHYAEHQTTAAEVVKKEILESYRDFAFTVAPIIADLDPSCYGLPESEKIARDIFALPNVEPASHTHSHPLFWHYFANYTPRKEEPLLSRYPEKPKNKASMMEDIKDKTTGDWKAGAVADNSPHMLSPQITGSEEEKSFLDTTVYTRYETPRSYACTPFSLDQEIVGSIERIDGLLPPGKKAKLIQWSGDTSPFEEALKKTREAGLLNINGGDSRFDNEYPSYASVAPIGLQMGSERQIYSSNSNENTYTNLWTGRFFGFRYLQKTVENTESPLRVRPFNLYFHMYSGQKLASLNAVRENLDYARTQKLIPITASHYAAIANGFYSARIIALENGAWKIAHRGAINTLRFDQATGLGVDFDGSSGVWGQYYINNSLYIALDPEAQEPVVRLKKNMNPNNLMVESRPYLVDSRWEIKSLHISENLLTIQTLGYGKGEMSWIMPKSGNYLITASDANTPHPVFETQATAGQDGKLSFVIDVASPPVPLTVTIEKK